MLKAKTSIRVGGIKATKAGLTPQADQATRQDPQALDLGPAPELHLLLDAVNLHLDVHSPVPHEDPPLVGHEVRVDLLRANWNHECATT